MSCVIILRVAHSLIVKQEVGGQSHHTLQKSEIQRNLEHMKQAEHFRLRLRERTEGNGTSYILV